VVRKTTKMLWCTRIIANQFPAKLELPEPIWEANLFAWKDQTRITQLSRFYGMSWNWS
jgi:hypothetical protein